MIIDGLQINNWSRPVIDEVRSGGGKVLVPRFHPLNQEASLVTHPRPPTNFKHKGTEGIGNDGGAAQPSFGE